MVRQAITQLGHRRFGERELAQAVLEYLGQEVVPALQKKLQEPIPLESHRRLQMLVERLNGPLADLKTLRHLAL